MKAVFLDRDGVINKRPREGDYVKSWNEFAFLPDVDEAIKLINKNNCLAIIITNQAGIGKGLFKEKELKEIHLKMQKELEKKRARIDAIYFCPHRPDENCSCRKPKTGMLNKAKSDFRLDLKDCYIIGDNPSDMETGKKVGCKTIFISREKENLPKVDHTACDLISAVKIIFRDLWCLL